MNVLETGNKWEKLGASGALNTAVEKHNILKIRSEKFGKI